MKSACKKIGLFLVCLFLTALTWAQTKRISGKVLSEEDNKPLVGVSVSVKGKSAGTQTDASGEFSIDATNGNILVVTYTGYIPQEVKVDNSTNLSLTMKADASKLGEVVVVGYGTQRRKEFAGSSTTVNPLTTKFTPSSNVGTALQGTVPGLTVQQTTGAPGSTPNIVFVVVRTSMVPGRH